MSNINNGYKINGTIESITIEKTEIILNQMKNSICKIEGKEIGTGFFCKINYQEKIIPVLITNAHILDKEFINLNKKVKISINDNKNIETMNIDENDIIYISPITNYDIIIIRLKENNEFNTYLELDESIFNNSSENIYENNSFYLLHYSKGEKACISYGNGITKIKDNKNIIYKCDINSSSSGAPILNLNSNKVIGIHKGNYINKESNIGTFLKYPLSEMNNINNINNNASLNNEIIKKDESVINNEIKIEMKINKEDINKNIYFLDNSVFNSYLNELNDSNTELFINEKKFKYEKYFIPEKEGIYTINIKLKIFIKDCSHMFYNCKNIINIDLSSFSSKDIINTSYMFYECNNIEKINLDSFETKNVTNMESMFENCSNIESLDLSSFNTQKVENMMYMFSGCKKLKELDLSSFNTQNVNNLDLMFYNCSNLNQLKINKDSSDKIIENLKYTNIDIIKI